MKKRLLAFTLIELLIVIVIITFLAALLLPALSAAKKRALRMSMNAPARITNTTSKADVASGTAAAPAQPLAAVRNFTANVLLKPDLSVGTAEPESIYTVQLSAKCDVANPNGDGVCQVWLPLPPQIISLADLEVAVDGQPSESVEIQGDKLAWVGRLSNRPAALTVKYSAVGKGLYHLQPPPGGIVDVFHIDLTAAGSDVRMLELSLQPTKYVRSAGQTVYTWDYKKFLYGRPISLDVLGIAPLDRLGELTWLGPSSVVVFGLILGLVARAFDIRRIDRWMLLLILGTFTGAYPLMYFAQEFIPVKAAVWVSALLVLAIIGVRGVTIAGLGLGVIGTVLPAAAILAVTLVAAIHTRLQGLLITCVGLGLFILTMLLMPRLKPQPLTR